jgi:hypothetical protein
MISTPICEASSRAETTIAFEVTKPVGSTVFSFDLQPKTAKASRKSIFFIK